MLKTASCSVDGKFGYKYYSFEILNLSLPPFRFYEVTMIIQTDRYLNPSFHPRSMVFRCISTEIHVLPAICEMPKLVEFHSRKTVGNESTFDLPQIVQTLQAVKF